jgi:hypothetical protein
MKKHQYMVECDELTLKSQTLDYFKIIPYIIKIDVEGAELLVLRGASDTLKETKLIFFECNEVHFKNYNYTATDLFKFLKEYNFKIYNLDMIELSETDFVYLTADERRYENPKEYQSNFFAIMEGVL